MSDAWLDTVRIAKDMGTAKLLFPVGVEDIRELPAPHFDAVRLSLIFLSFEELPKDEQPPRKIWLDDEELKRHFAAVEQKRKDEADPNRSASEEPMKSNSLAKQMIVQ